MPKRPRGNEWGGGGAHGRRRSRGSGDAEADQGDKVAGTEIHPEVETVLHRLPDGVVRQALSFLAGVWVQNADIVIEFEYYCIMLPFTSCQRPVVLKASTAMLSSFARILCTAAHFCSATAKLTILLTGLCGAPWFVPGNDVGNFCYTCKLARPYFHCVSELTLANATALPR